MADLNSFLSKLHQNLNILQEREARHGSNAPLDLLNQINDHKKAIVLVEQAIAGELTQAELEAALKPFNLAEPGITFGQRINNFFFGSDYLRQQRNRQAMLNLVDSIWIKGVLKNSLHGAVLIELGLAECREAVEHPLEIVLQTGQENHKLPPETKIVNVFNEMGRNLLILGQPGAGKTTMLLDLARDLIAQAKKDVSQPIPVVFNLSSWVDTKQSIDDWLVQELISPLYGIPKKIAQSWVDNDELLLLLDGLDEVAIERRGACVQAINEFCQNHIATMVVCSRTEDYEILKTRLRLQSAVVLQPITLSQIEKHLAAVAAQTKSGDEFMPVLKTLQSDEELQELAESPLMLNIMMMAAKGISVHKLKNLKGVKIRRKYLFDVYVKEMYKRRRMEQAYTPKQTTQWLSWLAQRLSEHSQTVFWLERLQPSWLQTPPWRWAYTLASRLNGVLIYELISMLIGVLIVKLIIIGLIDLLHEGLPEGLIDELNVGLNVGLSNRLVIGLVVGLVFGLVVGFIDVLRFEWLGKRIEVGKPPPLWWKVINVLIVGLIVGLSSVLIYGLIYGLIFGLREGLTLGLTFGLIFGLRGGLREGLIYGLIFGLRGSRQSLINDIQTVEALHWSWRKALKGWLISGLIIGLTFGLLFGLLVGVFVGLLEGLLNGLIFGLIGGLLFGLIGGLLYGLIGAIFNGLRHKFIKTKAAPNQGIRLSSRNAIFGGLTVGIIVGLIFGLLSGLSGGLLFGLLFGVLEGMLEGLLKGVIFGLMGGLIVGLIWGLIFGVLGTLWYGGLDVIQHYTLRLTLIIRGHTPRNYVTFLDHAADRIFLRKVGGGYAFIHRYLMEYFATLEPEK